MPPVSLRPAAYLGWSDDVARHQPVAQSCWRRTSDTQYYSSVERMGAARYTGRKLAQSAWQDSILPCHWTEHRSDFSLLCKAEHTRYCTNVMGTTIPVETRRSGCMEAVLVKTKAAHRYGLVALADETQMLPYLRIMERSLGGRTCECGYPEAC